MRKVYCSKCGKLMLSTDCNIYPRSIELNSIFFTDGGKIKHKDQYLSPSDKFYEFCKKCAGRFDKAMQKIQEEF